MSPTKQPARVSWRLRFARWLGLAEPQRTFVWCSGCGNEYVSDSATQYHYDDDGLVHYQCGDCGLRSTWNFDAPAPFFVRLDDVSIQPHPASPEAKLIKTEEPG